jgi:multidrug resistance efflux pump
MIRAYLIPMLAIAGVIFAMYTVVSGAKPPEAQPPVIEPPRAPFNAFVAGSGLVEASTQNIAVGAPVGAVVERVAVTVGDAIKKGDVLFELDTRELRAELASREAAMGVARAQLEKLRQGTRPEEIPPAEARVVEAAAAQRAAQAQLDEAVSQLTRAKAMEDARSMSAEEMARRQFAVAAAEARVAQAVAAKSESDAQVALLRAGTWAPDLAVAESQVVQAQAAVDATRIELDRRTVRSPVDGRVLQSNIRAGEFAQAGALSTPLMLVGGVSPLHVRIDVDEHEAWRVTPGARAEAFVRGNKDIKTALTFVRYEPYIIPKRSLTGESTERVDTRVLQVVYSFDPAKLPIFVGQQMDVYIEAQAVDRGTPRPATEATGGGGT